ncbi:MAG TPA: Hsp20/alpha crystallin family protein [Chloroflexota bacterium]|nr:Hsp20/alpha crystallin family protein [Chloroflexota bacterium]
MPTNVVPRYQTPTSTPTRLPDVIDRLLRESVVLPPLAERFYEGTHPGLTSNLLETEAAYIVQFVLPGVNPEKLELKVMGHEMSLKGIIQVPSVEHANYIWHGFDGGEFVYTYTLPAEVNGESAKAELNHGILMVTLPKAESAKPKSVKVLVK